MTEEAYKGKGRGRNPNSWKNLPNKLPPDPSIAIERNKRNFKSGSYLALTTGLARCRLCVRQNRCEFFRKEGDCVVAATFAAAKREELIKLEHLEQSDYILIDELIKCLIAAFMVELYIEHKGWVEKGKLRSEVQFRFGPLAGRIESLCDKLGLTPLSRTKLKNDFKDPFDFARAIQEIEGDRE